ncbi:MAG TPA: LuxR C-terminal-related transcriptional regulator [Candidatus Limnocylindrales bacterium]|nr:LuxR C-terminal-related transcriptional regulator [Candidatus Limnocylindrales bacterium]
MNRSRRTGEAVWAQISDELARTPPDIHAVLTTVTQNLSRIEAGTWVAQVMNPDPTTSRMVVTDDAERAMAEYVERITAAASQPSGTPTFGLAERVIADTVARNSRRSLFTLEGFKTYVRIPLRNRGTFIVVLEMFNRSVAEWDSDSLDFFETLAGIAALAIDSPASTVRRSAAIPAGSMRRPQPDLSDLELTILRLIVEGLTNREISARVHRSENTVKANVRRILEKTKAINRTDLAHRAGQESWLRPRA